MAEPLTNNPEPGFYSRIQENPSLFLTPGSVQTVGIVGTGKSTKTTVNGVTRGAHKADVLGNPIKSVNIASSDVVYRYPQSSSAIAQMGSADLALVTLGTLTGKVFTATVDGESAETWTFTVLASVQDIADQINANFDDLTAEISIAGAVKYLVLHVSGTGLDGKSFTVGSGNANPILGLVDAARAQAIWWDPAVTDEEFAPQLGQDYSLDFERPKVAADFWPKAFSGLTQVANEYGEGDLYTLTLGAQGSFGNGCSLVICRQLDPATLGDPTDKKDEILASMTDLEAWDIDILVPMVPINEDGVRGTDSVDTEYLDHVSKMSSKLNRKERICILGVDEKSGRLGILGTTGETWENQMSAFAAGTGSGLESKRVVVVNPGACITSYKGASVTPDGTYLASCLAGKMCSPVFDEAEPMTRKVLSNIDGLILPDLTRPDKNLLTSMGVTILEVAGAGVRVRRSITADSSSIASQEPSIVRAFDRVAKDLREALENRFVGTKILNTTSTAVEAATSTFLNRYVAEELIGAFRNVHAQQNAQEPRQFDVSFEAIPVFPFIWGFIDISINIS